MGYSIDPRRRENLTEGLVVVLAIALVVMLARPYAASWNDGSRLASVESLVDHHTWIIDQSIFVQVPSPEDSNTPLPYSARDRHLLEHGTQDKLFIDGHYYSDKSPVPAVLMAGAYQLWKSITGITARSNPDHFCRTMTIVFSGMPYVLAVWCIYRMGVRLTLPLSSRLLLTASLALATVALPYARQVNNHILLLAVVSALVLQVAKLREEVQNNRICWKNFASLGFFAGLGYTIDLGVGPVCLLCTAALVMSHSFGREPLGNTRLLLAAKRTMVFGLASMPWVVLHHALNYAIGGTLRPANANPEYFRWPGCPFAIDHLTGSWIHPNVASFLLYAASMLAGKRGFLGHNLPLFLTIPALFMLLRRHWELRREVLWALGCCAGTWLLYAATSNNSSGQCCTIRWFVPLLAPAYLVLGLLLRHYPHFHLDLLILSSWGMFLVVLMREGPWMGGMVPLFWPIQAAALFCWCLYRYLCHPDLVVTTQHPYTNSSGKSTSKDERLGLWITIRSSFGAHASTTSVTSTSTCRATNSSSSPE
ncbi:MAG TPA: hypothetical protein VH592_19005 [Gemmataceae bacterium]|jgi:hypothetical protein